jgi:hypothetical protein
VTSALLEAPTRAFAAPDRPGRIADGDGVTLEERLKQTWRALQAQGTAECPLCKSRMTQVERGGECTSCGTRLS